LKKISLREKFASFEELWKPKTVARVDDFAIKLVKLDGEFVWHHHADADEIFFVVAGGIRMKYRSEGQELEEAFGPGELLRVPRGVEHMPIALPGTELILFERADLVNTGNVENERTIASSPI
jgi:mannose-6-phosphate isomerase-like protein (cupin superfamily)